MRFLTFKMPLSSLLNHLRVVKLALSFANANVLRCKRKTELMQKLHKHDQLLEILCTYCLVL